DLLSIGAPVSVLIDYGLAETIVDSLVKGDIGTIEKLGSMTPELLEAMEGMDENAVSLIQQAINSYYGTEYAEETPAPAEAVAPAEEVAATDDTALEGSATMSESVEAGAEAGAE